MQLHHQIRKARESRGYTQHMLAEMLGFRDYSAISKLESGRCNPTASTLARLAAALDTVFVIAPNVILNSEERMQEIRDFVDDMFSVPEESADTMTSKPWVLRALAKKDGMP